MSQGGYFFAHSSGGLRPTNPKKQSIRHMIGGSLYPDRLQPVDRRSKAQTTYLSTTTRHASHRSVRAHLDGLVDCDTILHHDDRRIREAGLVQAREGKRPLHRSIVCVRFRQERQHLLRLSTPGEERASLGSSARNTRKPQRPRVQSLSTP